jgi:hypothetical protein
MHIKVGLREFCFNSVMAKSDNQQRVYEKVARGLIMDFINGYNATAIVYGQTGSQII